MTPKVPKARCKRCRHYNEWYGCHLDDLTPCPYHRELKPWQIYLRIVVLPLVVLAVLIAVMLLHTGCSQHEEPQQEYHWSAVELLRNQHKKELSDFDKLTLAIALTESRFNPDADSGQGDHGLLQLRSIYIAEVNRLYDTEYTIEDAFDIDKSLAMFHLLQGYYNPSKDINKAIQYHNRNQNYKRVVMENYELICRMEEVRAKLIER